MQKTFTSQDD